MTRGSLLRIAETWGKLDFVVQSIAFSPRDTLCGRVAGAATERFLTTMEISVWSYIRMARLAEPLMPDEGSLTLYIDAATTSAISPSDCGHTKRTMYSSPLQYTAF